MSDDQDRSTGQPPPATEPGTRTGGFETSGHLDEDDCIELVAGLMPDARRGRALDHAGACPDCERRLMAASGDLEAARARPAPAGWAMPATASAAPADPRSPWPPAPAPPRRIMRIAVPLALAAALAVVLLKTWPHADRLPAFEAYWMPATVDLGRLRGTGRDADSLFWQGLTAYESHDAARARELLGSARDSGGLEDLRRLYLASALVNDHEAEAALAILDTMNIEQIPMPWRDDARWMKFLALVQLQRTSEARRLLDRLAGQPGPVGERARQILGR